MKRGARRLPFSQGTNSASTKGLCHGIWLAAALSLGFCDVALARDSVGLYAPKKKTFYLKNETNSGPAEQSFRLEKVKKGSFPILGDWDGDGDKTIGVYHPKKGMFYLRNENTRGPAEVQFRFPNAKRTWRPVAGDWDRDGVDTVGLYDPTNGTFHLLNAHSSSLDGHQEFRLELAGRRWRPVAGDWDGDGDDTVGLYDPRTRTFHLWDENTSGMPAHSFVFANAPKKSWPLAGDWNGDGMETVGLFHPKKKTFYLRDSNDAGSAEYRFKITGAKKARRPVAWNIPEDGSATDSGNDSGDGSTDPNNPQTVIFHATFKGSVLAGESRLFQIDVPASATQTEVKLFNVTGDAGLALYRSSSDSSAPKDCVSQTSGTVTKVCTVTNAGAETWVIQVDGQQPTDFILFVQVFGRVGGG